MNQSINVLINKRGKAGTGYIKSSKAFIDYFQSIDDV